MHSLASGNKKLKFSKLHKGTKSGGHTNKNVIYSTNTPETFKVTQRLCEAICQAKYVIQYRSCLYIPVLVCGCVALRVSARAKS
ncbi:MAG: hypothetical protein MJE68_15905, partial [Proteobacteria bacterium]|nr:hypothetical protein [Pseudomonadota bacterium]